MKLEQSRHRRGEVSFLPLAGLVAIPLLMLVLGAGVAWRDAWREAATDLTQTTEAVTEYAQRVLTAHAVAAGRVDAVLRGLSDEAIRAREAELHDELRELVSELPQAEAAFVIDREGGLLVSANVLPVSRAPAFAADREFFQALRGPGAPAVHVSRVFVGRLDGALFFAVSRRRTRTGNAGAEGFDGIVNISVYPNRLAESLRQIAFRPSDSITLIRDDGEMLARSSGQTAPVRLAADSAFARLAAAGVERATYRGATSADGAPALFAIRRVAGWPVYASAGRRRSDIVAAWRARVVRQLAVGVPATLALLLLAAAVLRGQRRLAAASELLEVRVAERTADLAASEERLALASAAARIGVWDWPEGAADAVVNPGYLSLYGLPEGTGTLPFETWAGLLHPDDRDRAVAAARQAAKAPGPYADEFRIRRADTGEERWIAARGRRVERGAGPARLMGVNTDVTERRAEQERQTLLAREVDHRAKNVLAVVRSIVKLTRAEDPRGFAEAVEGRVAALARAHTLLARDRWTGALFGDLAREELAAHGEARVSLAGPPLRLVPDAVQPLSMALHELATNAAKYGALSAPGGRVELSWSQGDGRIALVWRERGGPPVAAPPTGRGGFGHDLLDATLRGQLGGELRFEWAPEGLVCRITLPATHAVPAPAPAEAAPAAPATSRANPVAAALAGRRILLVEDEPLVAMEAAWALRAAGCEVLGPAATLAEALRLAASGRPDAAALDVNLRGESSYPAAELLAAQGVPVVFVTGYGELPHNAAALAAAVLRKPLRDGELTAALAAALARAAAPPADASLADASLADASLADAPPANAPPARACPVAAAQ